MISDHVAVVGSIIEDVLRVDELVGNSILLEVLERGHHLGEDLPEELLGDWGSLLPEPGDLVIERLWQWLL